MNMAFNQAYQAFYKKKKKNDWKKELKKRKSKIASVLDIRVIRYRICNNYD